MHDNFISKSLTLDVYVLATCVVKKQNTIQLSHQARLTRGKFWLCENISSPPLAIQARLGTRLSTHKIWKLLAHAQYCTTCFIYNFARLCKTTVTGRLSDCAYNVRIHNVHMRVHLICDDGAPFQSFWREHCCLEDLEIHLTCVVSVVLFVWQPLPMCKLIRKSGQWNIVLVPGWWCKVWKPSSLRCPCLSLLLPSGISVSPWRDELAPECQLP